MKRPTSLAIACALLLSALLAPLEGAAAEGRNFPETGHSVGGDFLTFFDQYGSLDLFGYPSTDEVDEGGRRVQYFQRVRMELWPENPWPYRVQLGLLAVALGKSQPAVTAQSAGAQGTRFFPETGHSLAAPFSDFWDRNGGLLLFGYPISEPSVENGFTVQYFQRARFELHPENPPPYQVQLGLLGDEYLMAQKKAVGPSPAGSPPPATPRTSTSPGTLAFQSPADGLVYLMKGDGETLIPLAPGSDPAWSPDGSRIAFSQSDYPPGLYVMNADGSTKSMLYPTENAQSIAWSPDGGKIAFVQQYQRLANKMIRGRLQGYIQDYSAIKILNLADGRVTDLPFNDPFETLEQPQSFAPTWAPDSRRVAYAGIRGLYVSTVDGDVPRVRNTDTRFASPVWSPDGQRFAFSYKQHDHWEVGVISTSGEGLKLLTSSPPFTRPANNAAPAWSPDGSKIAFVTDREGDWRIYVMDADGRNQSRLLDTPIPYGWSNKSFLSWTK